MVLAIKDTPAKAGDRRCGVIPGWGSSPGGGDGNPLQCSCLGNSMDRGDWRATVHGNRRVGHEGSNLAKKKKNKKKKVLL